MKQEKYLEAIRDSYLCQHVTFNTRHQINQESNILDLILTNEDNMINNLDVKAPIGKSDHLVITFDYKCYTQETYSKNTCYQYSRGNYSQMNKDLQMDWASLLKDKDVEELWQIFSTILKNAQDKNIPQKNITNERKNKANWINQKAKCKLRKKYKMWKKYCETDSYQNYVKYTKARNQARWATRQAMKGYEKQIAKNIKKNPKPLWKYVKSKSKTRDSIPDLEWEQKIVVNNQEKAEVLDHFFVITFT